MDRKSLYVTVTADCEDLANKTFRSWQEWEITDEDYNDDGTCVIRYEWNGEGESSVELNLNANPDVINYQIL